MKKRVIVVGTRFGRVYLAGIASPACEAELVGILALGSPLSHACAKHYRVPLYTVVDAIPANVDLACVVVGSAANGGAGCQLAKQLMARGIHVIQEHPVQHTELADCLRYAHERCVVYRVNTHYVNLTPVRRFIAAARRLRQLQPPMFIDAVAGFQTAYTLFDILGEALGGLRPWRFTPARPRSAELDALSTETPPYRCLEGVIAGVPATIRIQHQLAPLEPDNLVHCFHRITLGTEGGHLTLSNTHGPVFWCPRPHMPPDVHDRVCFHDSSAPHLDFPSSELLGPARAPTYREILSEVWPAGIRTAVSELVGSITRAAERTRRAQYDLSVSHIWSDAMAQLGPIELLEARTPDILAAGQLRHADATTSESLQS